MAWEHMAALEHAIQREGTKTEERVEAKRVDLKLFRYDLDFGTGELGESIDGDWLKWSEATSPAGLHVLLDLLVAQYIQAHPSGAGLPSQTSVLAFMQWSYRRCQAEALRAETEATDASR